VGAQLLYHGLAIQQLSSPNQEGVVVSPLASASAKARASAESGNALPFLAL